MKRPLERIRKASRKIRFGTAKVKRLILLYRRDLLFAYSIARNPFHLDVEFGTDEADLP